MEHQFYLIIFLRVSQVRSQLRYMVPMEKQQTFDRVVWLDEKYRNNLDVLSNLLIDIAGGQTTFT